MGRRVLFDLSQPLRYLSDSNPLPRKNKPTPKRVEIEGQVMLLVMANQILLCRWQRMGLVLCDTLLSLAAPLAGQTTSDIALHR